MAPKALSVVESSKETCRFRWIVPNRKTGSEGKAYMESITGFQIQHNGLISLPHQLPHDRLGNVKYEGSVKLVEGINTIAVRLLFEEEGKRLSPANWTAWSQPLDPPPIGPTTVKVRQDRLLEYLNPSSALLAAKTSEEEAETERMTSAYLDVKNDETGAHTSAQGGTQTPARTSVAAVMKGKEAKAVHKLEHSGPPNEVKQRFGLTRLSPFVLNPTDASLATSKQVVSLNLGENWIYSDPLDTGQDASYCTVHAYLRRVLIGTKEPDMVILITQPEDDDEDFRPVPKGFQRLGDECVRTVLKPGQQYAAGLGDKIEFLDTGVEYIVGRQTIERAPTKKKTITDPVSGMARPEQTKLGNAVELYMSIASDFNLYVPTSLVQRAQVRKFAC